MGDARPQGSADNGRGEGIGAATAQALADQGASLVLLDLDEAALTALTAELGDERALGAVCDVRDLASVERAVADGIERFGGLDLVLANAGVASYGSVLAVDPERSSWSSTSTCWASFILCGPRCRR